MRSSNDDVAFKVMSSPAPVPRLRFFAARAIT